MALARPSSPSAGPPTPATEDKTEKKPLTKAQKKADRVEDKAERKKFLACIHGS